MKSENSKKESLTPDPSPKGEGSKMKFGYKLKSFVTQRKLKNLKTQKLKNSLTHKLKNYNKKWQTNRNNSSCRLK